jgi:hypothetical protein
MFWENKLEELGKLAPVVLQMVQRGRWQAQLLATVRINDDITVEIAPLAEGSTPAGSVDALWKKLADDLKPILIYADPGKPVRRVRFNARWEDIAIDVKQEVTKAGTTIVTKTEIVDKLVAETIGAHEHKAIVVEEPESPVFDPAD